MDIKTAQQICSQAGGHELYPQAPHGGRRELTTTSCSLNSICAPWHAYSHTYIHMHRYNE